MFRRLLGLIIIVVSLILVALLLGGAYYVGQVVDAVGESFDNILMLTVDTLDNVSQTLEQTKATVAEANNALDTAAEAAVNLSVTMNDMQPLLASTTKVVSEDVPSNIEAVQTTIPNIAQVAGVIDGALTRLSDFGISQTIPIPFNPIELEFDLGIDYEPNEPFDETIWALGDSLEGMPEELRSLQGDLDTLAEDLDLLTGNIESASGDIEKINEEVALFIPIIDEYLRIVGQINGSMVEARAQIFAQLETVKTALVVLLVFLSLTQLTPLYVGWELITGQRSPKSSQQAVEEAPPPVVVEKLDEETPQQIPEESEEISEKDAVAEPVESEPSEPVEEMVDAPPETVVEEPQDVEQSPVAEETEDVTAETMVEKPQDSSAEIDEQPEAQDSEGEETQV